MQSNKKKLSQFFKNNYFKDVQAWLYNIKPTLPN